MKCYVDKKLKNPEFKKGHEEYLLRFKIGFAIAERRQKLGLTQADVAKRAGISQQLFSRVENCENYTIDTLYKISRALDMDLFRRTPSILRKKDAGNDHRPARAMVANI